MQSLAINLLTYEAEYLLPFVLKAVLPFINEARVIDTGSTDRTMEILKEIKTSYPFLEYDRFDVQHLGRTWIDNEKNTALTELLNKLRIETKSEWILKIDDDEIFPDLTMRDILDLEPPPDRFVYSVYFYHLEGDHILDPYHHRNFQPIRLFRNMPELTWEGNYGHEVIAYNKHRLNSRKYQGVKHPFLHLGELRTGIWKHDYRFHEPGHCGIPIPEEYRKYVPNQT